MTVLYIRWKSSVWFFWFSMEKQCRKELPIRSAPQRIRFRRFQMFSWWTFEFYSSSIFKLVKWVSFEMSNNGTQQQYIFAPGKENTLCVMWFWYTKPLTLHSKRWARLKVSLLSNGLWFIARMHAHKKNQSRHCLIYMPHIFYLWFWYIFFYRQLRLDNHL